MIRIQRRISRKRYLRSKRVYEYERVSLPIPRKYHETVKPLLNKDLEAKLSTEKDSVTIVLTPAKTFRHAGNTPQKNPTEEHIVN